MNSNEFDRAQDCIKYMAIIAVGAAFVLGFYLGLAAERGGW